ncbi:hypothetical protein SP19_109 [Salmonella phage 19]|nr:hypothetical protein SP19_109 [Salmonella phage 19]
MKEIEEEVDYHLLRMKEMINISTDLSCHLTPFDGSGKYLRTTVGIGC